MLNRPIFDKAPTIKMIDPLAIALGALGREEPLVCTYEDAVRLAGHSCPAISGSTR